MNITVAGSKVVWESDDGQKKIVEIKTTDGKKLKSWNDTWNNGQTYEVTVTERPSKNPKFGNEFWVEESGYQGVRAVKAAFAPENKNKSFALAYAKDIVVALISSVPDYGKTADISDVTVSLAEEFNAYLDGKKPDDLPY
jgi:hypothetical protein